MDEAWCPVCDRLIPPIKLQIFPDTAALDSANSTDANTTSEKNDHISPARPDGLAKRAKSSKTALKTTASGRRLNKLVPTPAEESETTPKGGGNADPIAPSSNDAAISSSTATSKIQVPGRKPKPRTILTHPASLYCSERCRLVDQHNYNSSMMLGQYSPSSSYGSTSAALASYQPPMVNTNAPPISRSRTMSRRGSATATTSASNALPNGAVTTPGLQAPFYLASPLLSPPANSGWPTNNNYNNNNNNNNGSDDDAHDGHGQYYSYALPAVDPDRANTDYFRSLRRGESAGFFTTTALPRSRSPKSRHSDPSAVEFQDKTARVRRRKNTTGPVGLTMTPSQSPSNDNNGIAHHHHHHHHGDKESSSESAGSIFDSTSGDNNIGTRPAGTRHTTFALHGMTSMSGGGGGSSANSSLAASASASASRPTRPSRSRKSSGAATAAAAASSSAPPAYVPTNGYLTHFSGLSARAEPAYYTNYGLSRDQRSPRQSKRVGSSPDEVIHTSSRRPSKSRSASYRGQSFSETARIKSIKRGAHGAEEYQLGANDESDTTVSDVDEEDVTLSPRTKKNTRTDSMTTAPSSGSVAALIDTQQQDLETIKVVSSPASNITAVPTRRPKPILRRGTTTAVGSPTKQSSISEVGGIASTAPASSTLSSIKLKLNGKKTSDRAEAKERPEHLHGLLVHVSLPRVHSATSGLTITQNSRAVPPSLSLATASSVPADAHSELKRRDVNDFSNLIPVRDVLPPRRRTNSGNTATTGDADIPRGIGWSSSNTATGGAGGAYDRTQHHRRTQSANASRSASLTPAHSYRAHARLPSLVEDAGHNHGPGPGAIGLDLETYVPTYPMEILPGAPGEKRKRLFYFGGT